MKKRVKTQKRLDQISPKSKSHIIIDFGTYSDPAIIRRKYQNPVKVIGNHFVRAYGNCAIEAYDNSIVEAYEQCRVIAFDKCTVCALNKSHVTISGNCTVIAFGDSVIEAESRSNIYAFDHSYISVRDAYSRVGKIGNGVHVAYRYN